jgi:hypothetical protein
MSAIVSSLWTILTSYRPNAARDRQCVGVFPESKVSPCVSPCVSSLHVSSCHFVSLRHSCLVSCSINTSSPPVSRYAPDGIRSISPSSGPVSMEPLIGADTPRELLFVPDSQPGASPNPVASLIPQSTEGERTPPIRGLRSDIQTPRIRSPEAKD